MNITLPSAGLMLLAKCTTFILDRLDIHTEGGLKAILDRLDEVERRLAGQVS